MKKIIVIILSLFLLASCGSRLPSKSALVEGPINPICFIGCYTVIGVIDADREKKIDTDIDKTRTRGTFIGIDKNKALN